MNEEVVSLTIQYKGKSAIERKVLSGREFCFGRSPDSALIIRDGYASRLHFKIYFEDSDLWIIDTGSTNGTLLNGEALTPKLASKVKVGDLVGIGNSDFVLEIFNIVLPEVPKIPAMLGIPAPEAFPAASRETVITEMPIANPTVEDSVPSTPKLPDVSAKLAAESAQIAEAQILEARAHEARMQEVRLQEVRAHEERLAEIRKLLVQEEARAEEVRLEAARVQELARVESEKTIESAKSEEVKILEAARAESQKLVQTASLQAQELVQEAEDKTKHLLEQSKVEIAESIERASIENSKAISEAEAKITELAKAAKADAAKLIEAAKQDSSTLLEATKIEASKLLETAKHDSEVLLKQAKEEDNQIRLQLQNDRRDLVQEVQEISEKQKAVHSELAKLETKAAEAKQANEKLQSENKELSLQHKSFVETLEKQKLELHSVQVQVKDLLERKQQTEKEFEAKKLQLSSDLATQERTNQQIFNAIKKRIEQAELEEKKAHQALADQLEAFRKQEQAAKLELNSKLEKLEAEYQNVRQQEQVKLDNFLARETKLAQQKHRQMLEDLVESSKKVSARLWFDLEKLLMVKLSAPQVSEFSEPVKELVQQHLTLKSMQELTGTSVQESSFTKVRGKVARHWKAFAYGAGSAAASIALYVVLFVGVNWSANPVQQDMADKLQQRQEDLAKRKFNPSKGLEIKDTLMDSVIYTDGFVEAYQDQKFIMSLTKSTNIFMLKTFLVSEEKSIAAIGTLAATIQALEEKKQNVHPDFLNKDLAKMAEFEKQQLEKVKDLLGTEVRVDALLKHQQEFFLEFKKRSPAAESK